MALFLFLEGLELPVQDYSEMTARLVITVADIKATVCKHNILGAAVYT